MSANAPPKPKHETWEDWLSPEGREEGLSVAEPLLTREGLIHELSSLGCEASARDLVYWQTKGVIPYPIRQKRHGKSVAMYPFWMPQVIHMLRNLQKEGRTLREIGPLLRHFVYHWFEPQPQTPKVEADRRRRRARRALYPLVSELEPLLHSFARIHEEMHDDHIVGLEIHLIREDGTPYRYPLLSTLFSHRGDGDEDEPGGLVDGVKDLV